MSEAPTSDLLKRIEAYLDAVPRNASTPEAVSKFTLFKPLGPWKYYARPTLGSEQTIERTDVDALRGRQRELHLPENIEWVVETTPSLAGAARASGLAVHEYPLLVLEGGYREPVPSPDGTEIRILKADDEQFARAHAVAMVAFEAAGTHVGSPGAADRDERAAAMKSAVLDFMHERHRRGWSVSYAAFDQAVRSPWVPISL